MTVQPVFVLALLSMASLWPEVDLNHWSANPEPPKLAAQFSDQRPD